MNLFAYFDERIALKRVSVFMNHPVCIYFVHFNRVPIIG